MTKPSNIASIESATGRKWDDWVALLDSAGARDLDHPAIAELVRQHMDENITSPGWWAQGVAVAYEQHIGRRLPGQVADGSFEVAVSKTISGTKEDAMRMFEDTIGSLTKFNGVKIESSRTSGTDKRLYWKAELKDGTRTIVAAEGKQAGKAMLVATQIKIMSLDEAEHWRIYWKKSLARL